jgi:hypothetical protein
MVVRKLKRLRTPVLKRTNLATFLIVFNNAVINLNHFVQKLLRGDTQTDRQTES